MHMRSTYLQERKGQAVASEDLLGSAAMPAAPPHLATAITSAAGDSRKEKRKRDKKEKKDKEKKVLCLLKLAGLQFESMRA